MVVYLYYNFYLIVKLIGIQFFIRLYCFNSNQQTCSLSARTWILGPRYQNGVGVANVYCVFSAFCGKCCLMVFSSVFDFFGKIHYENGSK